MQVLWRAHLQGVEVVVVVGQEDVELEREACGLLETQRQRGQTQPVARVHIARERHAHVLTHQHPRVQRARRRQRELALFRQPRVKRYAQLAFGANTEPQFPLHVTASVPVCACDVRHSNRTPHHLIAQFSSISIYSSLSSLKLR